MDDRKPYDPVGLPYVVTWLSVSNEDRDLAYGPFPNHSSADAFAKALGRTEDHGGYTLQIVYPPADYGAR